MAHNYVVIVTCMDSQLLVKELTDQSEVVEYLQKLFNKAKTDPLTRNCSVLVVEGTLLSIRGDPVRVIKFADGMEYQINPEDQKDAADIVDFGLLPKSYRS